MTSSTRPRSVGVVGRIGLLALLATGLYLSEGEPFTVLFYVGYAAVGGLLAWRRPRNVVGWLLIYIGFCFIGTVTRGSYDLPALADGTAPLAEFISAWIAGWAGSAAFAGFAALTVLFPTGQLPAGRWRGPTMTYLIVTVAVVVISATGPEISFNPDGGASNIQFPNRFALFGWLPIWSFVSSDFLFLPVILLLVVGVAAMLLRYRRATGVLRLQLRWLVASVTFVVAAITFGLSSLAIFGEDLGGFAWIPAIAAYPTVPLAIGVAVLRYRLFEIDRIISRTISYLGISAVLFAVFAVVTLTIGSAIGDNPLTVAVSTLVIAALFNPLRIRMQRAVDRRFNRSRVDQEAALASFTVGLRDEVDVERLLGHVRSAVTDAVEPTTLTIWRRELGAQR